MKTYSMSVAMKHRFPLFILGLLVVNLSACRISTDYPYNPNTVTYYCQEKPAPKKVVIPYHRYYEFDHQNQGYYHETPMH